MLSEYITSLADVSFHVVASMYVRFRYSGINPMRFAVFLAYFCAVLRFSDPPYAPLYCISYRPNRFETIMFHAHTL